MQCDARSKMLFVLTATCRDKRREVVARRGSSCWDAACHEPHKRIPAAVQESPMHL